MKISLLITIVTERNILLANGITKNIGNAKKMNILFVSSFKIKDYSMYPHI